MSACNRELNAHFHSAASLKYHTPDPWHDTTPSQIILTLGRPVLALPRKYKCQARAASHPGLKPVTSCSLELTLFRLSYKGPVAKNWILILCHAEAGVTRTSVIKITTFFLLQLVKQNNILNSEHIWIRVILKQWQECVCFHNCKCWIKHAETSIQNDYL